MAPISLISPLASIGLRIFAASIAPSAAPAPTILCISSIKTIMLPSFLISSNTRLSLSSKSPLYFAPASIDVMSSIYIFFVFSSSGTLPPAILIARPSAMAVFPTPASPTRQGLFFERLKSISITRFVSRSRPKHGSILPSCASIVRFLPYPESADGSTLPFLLPCGVFFCVSAPWSSTASPEIPISCRNTEA